MRAVVAAGTGGPDVLSVGEVDAPRPGAGEVLIDVVATAVNRADTLQRQGFYPPPPGAPDTIGLECSGRIAELGEGVTGWSVGDEVCALLAGGGYAEHAWPCRSARSCRCRAASPWSRRPACPRSRRPCGPTSS